MDRARLLVSAYCLKRSVMHIARVFTCAQAAQSFGWQLPTPCLSAPLHAWAGRGNMALSYSTWLLCCSDPRRPVTLVEVRVSLSYLRIELGHVLQSDLGVHQARSLAAWLDIVGVSACCEAWQACAYSSQALLKTVDSICC